MKHIKGLKDLHTLTLTKNPSWLNKSENGDGYIDTNAAKFICPVAGIEMNGRYSFCFLRTCNCVLSERALKQVRDSLCPVCCKEYSKNEDVIPINGTEEQRKELYEKLTKRKDLKLKSKKKKEDKTKDKITTKSTLSDKASTSGIVSENVRNLSSANTVLGAKHKLQDEKIFQTQTFKSLFTSHSSAKRAKDKNGHWITYNPYHYAG
uniref:Replication termination factor 2 n=1 Tax=Ciona savignyi TaxID=51511 RepID=H2Y5F6_CIOSA